MDALALFGIDIHQIARDGVEVDLGGHFMQKLCDGLGVPAAAAGLEPRKVAAEGGNAQDGVRVLLELAIRDGFFDGDLEGGVRQITTR
jgi:hypothetical protein